MRSLPFPRRLQLVKLLRAHGLRDVERLREDELKDALARLSILMPDLTSEAPFVTQAPSSQSGPASLTAPAVDDDSDDPHALPRFREPRPFLPNGERTFVRVIAVKPRRLFVTWDLRWDLPDGATRLEVMWRDVLGASPSATELLEQQPSLSIPVDRLAPGWYVDIPADRLAVAVRFVIDAADGPVTIATSNVALTPPARPAPPGPLWLATLQPDVDRRTLRGAGLLQPELPVGASLDTRGEALPDAVLAPATVSSVPLSSSFRFAGHTEEAKPSSSTSAAAKSTSKSSSLSSSAMAGRS